MSKQHTGWRHKDLQQADHHGAFRRERLELRNTARESTGHQWRQCGVIVRSRFECWLSGLPLWLCFIYILSFTAAHNVCFSFCFLSFWPLRESMINLNCICLYICWWLLSVETQEFFQQYYTFSLKCTYLKGYESERGTDRRRHRYRHRQTEILYMLVTPQMFTLRDETDPSQELRLPFGSHLCMPRMKVSQPLMLPESAYSRRNLKSDWEIGLQFRHHRLWRRLQLNYCSQDNILLIVHH